MNRKDIIDISKLIAVETAKGYGKSILLNIAALGLLGVIGTVWMKIDEFRENRKKK